MFQFVYCWCCAVCVMLRFRVGAGVLCDVVCDVVWFVGVFVVMI